MKIDELENELQKLIDEAVEMYDDLGTKKGEKFFLGYEPWYTKSLMYVKTLNGDRLDDFKRFYKMEKRKEITYATYTVSDALAGICVPGRKLKPESILTKMFQQLSILIATKEILKTKVYQIQELLQADIFDNELNSAKELNKKGFYRAAGAICGVVLEEHFSQVLGKRTIKINKKNPTINDYNDALKENSIIDISTFRYIQFLGDLRNLCDHKKSTDPTKEQINDLIIGTEKIIKTVF